MEKRICRLCGQTKKLTSFPVQSGNASLRRYQCYTCRSEGGSRTKAVARGRKKKWKVLGILITPEEYAAKLEEQNGVCAICKEVPKKRSLAVDHCHKTNRVRRLLCITCNLGLGAFKDNPILLEKAAAYLREQQKLSPVAQLVE